MACPPNLKKPCHSQKECGDITLCLLAWRQAVLLSPEGQQPKIQVCHFPVAASSVSNSENCGRTVSNDTRVRIDGLVKIMAMVFPANGLKLSSRAASFSLTARTSICIRWDLSMAKEIYVHLAGPIRYGCVDRLPRHACLRISLSASYQCRPFAPLASIARISSVLKSSTCRKCWPTAGGDTPSPLYEPAARTSCSQANEELAQ